MDSLKIKFSVLGGSQLDGETGHDILKDLQSICSNISATKALKVSVHLDDNTKSKGLKEEIESIKLDKLNLNTEKIKLKFGIDKDHLKKLLNDFFKEYDLSKKAEKDPSSNSKRGAKGAKTTGASAVKKYASEYREVLRLERELKKAENSKASTKTKHELTGQINLRKQNVELARQEAVAAGEAAAVEEQRKLILNDHEIALSKMQDAQKKQARKAQDSADKQAYNKVLNEQKKIIELKNEIEKAQNSPELKAAYEAELAHHEKLLSSYKKQIKSQELLNDLKQEENRLKLENDTKGAKDKAEEAKKLLDVYQNAVSYMRQFGDAIRVNAPELYQELTDLLKELSDGSYSGGSSKAEEALKRIKRAASDSNATVETLGQKLAKTLGNNYVYGVIAALASAARRVTHQVWTNITEIDKAMTQLSIVTGKTGVSLESAFSRAAESAKALGANVTDLLGSMETFARLGYNMEESQTLANVATMMGNVASVSVDEATTGMTSIIKGFDLAVEDAEYVGDVLSNIGKNYAISAGELMEAFQRSGAAFHATGTSFEKATALITAANAAVQDSSTVGTAMKAVSARIRGATSELHEMGEEYDDIANGMSKYRTELMALTNVDGSGGFDIMEDVDAGKYKDIYDIFIGISKSWDQMSDTARSRVSEILGGTRQLQVISSIMGNITDATGAYNDALESTGSLAKDNAVYLDSLQGRLATLKATFQEFSNELLNSDAIKDLITLVTQFVEVLMTVNEKVNVLNFVGIFKGIFDVIKGVDNAAVAAGKSFGEFVAAGGALKKMGLPGKIGLIVAALSAINAVVQLITGQDLVGWFVEWTSTTEEKLAKLESSITDVNEQINEVSKSLRNLNSSYDSVVPRFLELYEKAGSTNIFGDTTLSSEEYAEFLDLQNQIAEMFPSIDLGIDSNGNHMLALSGNVDAVTNSLADLLDVYKQVEMQKAADLFGENLENYKSKAKTYEASIWKADGNATDLRTLKNQIANHKTLDEFTLSNVILSGKKYAKTDIEKDAYAAAATNQDYEWIKKFLDGKITYYETQADMYRSRLEGVFSGLNKDIPALVQSDVIFSQLDEASQDFAVRMSTGLDLETIFGNLSNVSEEDVTNCFSSFLQALKGANIDNLVASYLDGSLSLETVSAILTRELSDVDDAMKSAVIATFQKAGHAVESYDDVLQILLQDTIEYNKASKESDPLNPEPDAQGLINLLAALEGTRTELEEIQSIISKFSEKGFDEISEEEFTKLAEVLPTIRAEYQAYVSAIEAGAEPEAEQAKLLDKITNAAKRFQQTKIAEKIEDVADAAEDYGKNSSQVQEAMHELAQICPDVADALWDEANAMYDLSGASGTTAEAIRSFMSLSLAASINAMKLELASLESQFKQTAANALASGVIITGALSMTGKEDTSINSVAPKSKKAQALYQQTIAAKKKELSIAEQYAELLKGIDLSASTAGGGGGSSKTPADEIKEAYESLAASIEYQIQVQEQSFTQAQKNLNSQDMREALIRQVGYYREIQMQAQAATEAAKEYYRAQGMSDSEIELQSVVQDLSSAWIDATQDVNDALDRMTTAITQAFSQAVDEVQNVYKVLHDAADEYATSGFITIDTLQEVITLGVEYLALLQDENGQLVINEENIKKVIAARTEQMAVESALAYVEALRSAKIMGNTDELYRLLNATNEVTSATWGLVYANLGLAGLSESEYNAALNVIDALRSLADSAIHSIGKSTDQALNDLKEMQSGVDDILQYVMDMLKDGIDKQIESIEKQKEAFSEYIELRKEALDMAEEEVSYEEEKADLLKQLADLQSKIDELDLVGTREAEAQKAALLKEQQELQKDLSDLQSDYAYDAQVEALEKMDEAYADAKDEEIEKLEQSISSEQKLYDMAIAYIKDNWDNLLQQLTSWNYEYGNSLQSEIESAWDSAYKAAQRYGDYLTALENISIDVEKAGTNTNLTIGKTNYDHSATDDDHIRSLVTTMKANSDNWHSYGADHRNDVAAENQRLGAQLREYGVNAVYDSQTGIWYVDRIGGEQLYKKYAYHSGGVVGGGSIKQNEQFALLKKGETVLTEEAATSASSGIRILGKLGDMISGLFGGISSSLSYVLPSYGQKTDVSQISTANRNVTVTFGDTYITGANNATVKKHQEINKGFMDELARQLGAKW